MLNQKFTKNSRIYILCPPQKASGGPEALHQLYFKLRKLGHASFMYYHPISSDPVHERYKQYGVEFMLDIEDTSDNFLIVPEVNTTFLDSFNNIQKGIWWLSINNYFVSTSSLTHIVNRAIIKLTRSYNCHQLLGFKTEKFKEGIFHFAQSAYAKKFLIKKGLINVYMLSDYLNSAYIQERLPLPKENWIAYNKTKAFYFTNRLINSRPDLEWKAIENMTPTQVKELLSKSKVYVDFGNHPGKDRLPREAAICGCCIITGRDGSANFQEDVSIPEDYKFKASRENMERITKKIGNCFLNYLQESNQFSRYREKIKKEEDVFEKELVDFFGTPQKV